MTEMTRRRRLGWQRWQCEVGTMTQPCYGDDNAQPSSVKAWGEIQEQLAAELSLLHKGNPHALVSF
jgi:hypothetical protein